MVNVDWKLPVIAFVLASVATGVVRHYALRVNLLDLPNSRSSHSVPTPSGGGIGIVVAVLVSLFLVHQQHYVDTAEAYSLLCGGVLIAIVGLIDDHRHVPSAIRFAVHIAACGCVLVVVGGLPPVQFGNATVDLTYVGDVLTLTLMVWFVNAFNFMDGIDGIAAVEAICVCAGAFVIAAAVDNGAMTALSVGIAAASAGFLIWNLPPARIFMGDVGSAFLGFVIASQALWSHANGSLPVWTWLILAGVFLVDATVTLVTRIALRQNWTAAHRSHAYQRMARHFGSHGRVTATVLLVNCAWLLPLALIAAVFPKYGWWLVLVAWTPLVIAAFRIGAGRPD